MVGARPIENAHGIAADAQPVEWGGDDAERTNRPDIVEEIGAEHRTATDAPPPARRLGGVESDKINGLVTLDHRQQQGSRSEERRVGKECGSTGSFWGSQSH